MKDQAISHMLQLLPSCVGHFDGSEYPVPLKSTFLGEGSLEIADLRAGLATMDPSTDVKDVLQPLLLGAETYEASMEDKDKYFITDHRLRSLVFSGSKWRAGWALVLGGSSQAELISKLIEKGFMVFTDTPDLQDTFFIGSRQTSPIYFLQMMVRYGLTR